MDEKMNKQDICRLNIDDSIIKVLKENKIKTLGELCKKSKANLKAMGILPNQAERIEIELQLLGLNLKNSL